MTEEKILENLLRRQAKRLGLALRKSRAKRIHLDNFGEYGIIDPYENFVVAGSRFDLSLEDVKDFLDEYEKNMEEDQKNK